LRKISLGSCLLARTPACLGWMECGMIRSMLRPSRPSQVDRRPIMIITGESALSALPR
jgi:hypothetical protein